MKEFEAPNVKIWEKHANFIVNKGDATSEDVLEMMVKMHNAVKDTYTIELRPEIIFIGDKTEKEEQWLMENLYRMRREHLVEISESMKYCSQVESFFMVLVE